MSVKFSNCNDVNDLDDLDALDDLDVYLQTLP